MAEWNLIPPDLLDYGLVAMMGKGKHSPAMVEAMRCNGAVYFAAVGGAISLLSPRIVSSQVVAYEGLRV